MSLGVTRMNAQTYILNWRGIEIETRYVPRDFGGAIAHLELKSINPPKARIPMTETGYRSHFHPVGTIERDFGGDVVACVLDWLNAEAKSKKWRDYVENSKQLMLF